MSSSKTIATFVPHLVGVFKREVSGSQLSSRALENRREMMIEKLSPSMLTPPAIDLLRVRIDEEANTCCDHVSITGAVLRP